MLKLESPANYEYKYRRVKVDDIEYEASYPQGHGRINGIIYYWKDLNAYDDWANVSDYKLTFYIKYKGDRKWTKIEGKEYETTYWRYAGLNRLLFNLESDEVKREMIKNKRISELQEEIPKLQKELRSLK